MKKYIKVNTAKRFIIGIIDFLIVGAIDALFIFIIHNVLIKKAINDLHTYLDSSAETANSNLLSSANKQLIIGYVLILAIILIVKIIYYIVIPLKWEKQTIGRSIFNNKLVMENDTELKTNNFVMREIVGTLAMNALNGICCLGLLVQIILIRKDPVTTIHDKVAGTKMIDLNQEKKSEKNSLNINSKSYSENKQSNNNKYKKEEIENKEVIKDEDEDIFDIFND